MTNDNVSRPTQSGHRWAIWAALVLGVMFLALSMPLIAQTAESRQLTATGEQLDADS